MTHFSSDCTCVSSNNSSSRTQDDQSVSVNRCRMNGPTASSERRSSDQLTPADKATLDAIYMTAKEANKQAEKFINEYVMTTFGMSVQKHHSNHRTNSYEWLRGNFVIPKDLNKPVEIEHLKNLILNPQEVVLNIYGFLQRLAVAFEQIVKDNAVLNEKFKGEFEEARKHLEKMSSEIIDLIDEDRLKSYENVTDNIMPEDLRSLKLDDSHRNIRDWLVFRDYVNVIEYIMLVIDYFRQEIAKMA